ncbi:MAG: T9SS type A sorting domain-containing protein [Chitinophagales bacterium]
MLKTLIYLALWASASIFFVKNEANAHSHHNHKHETKISFIENGGQWHENILYKGSLNGLNTIFLEKQAFTFVYFDKEDMKNMHDFSQATESEKAKYCMKGHSYKVNFLNSKTPTIIKGIDKHRAYHNYFLGNDSKKWAKKMGVYGGIFYENLYQNIHLSAYSANNSLKYDFVVEANADASQIALQYDGTDRMSVQNGRLVSYLSIETIIEQKPYAYQIVDGKETQVACNYVLDEKTKILSFDFPDGYDKNLQLVIDPEVVAATLSGTTGFSSNYGHSATFDAEENIFTAAISFDSAYPTTLGAFQTAYGGGGTDIAISKLNPTGTDLIYATFLGGNGGDYPHSLFADNNLNLHILGSSDSQNYPTSNNAFNTTPNGNVDIIVSVLSADGSDLIGSTYLGGTAEDGRNTTSNNYGDQYRGEIIADAVGNSYIASCTSSADFPVLANAIQTDFLGGNGINQNQDGVLFKLNNDLSTLEWSTYLGSSENDMCFGLRLDENENIYVCGAAGADDFPSVVGGYEETHIGGNDAFILHISADGSNILNSTFSGGILNDWAFFIDIDNEGDVAIFGQTETNVTLYPDDIYTQDGNQFIANFKTDLSDIKYMTSIGGSSLTPTAFMIDHCGYIYFSGYNAEAGLETTSDAILNDGGFYIGVLEPNSTGLHYATYYTGNHVDGGTSRFSKKGMLYQAVCSGGFFLTNDDAYAPTQSTSWDIGVFKIDIGTNGANAVTSSSINTIGCVPLTVDFSSFGSSGTEFLWDFADGNLSTEISPTHIFTETGIFEVQLIANNPTSCNLSDTTYLQVSVLDGDEIFVQEIGICENEVFTLQAPNSENAFYVWQDGSTNQTFVGTEEGTYWVTTTFPNLSNCSQTDSFYVNYMNESLDLGEDIFEIADFNYTLDATTTNATYLWSNGSNESSITVSETGEYWVAVYLGNCVTTDSIYLGFLNSSIENNDILHTQIKVFPNPMQNQLSVEMDNIVFEQAERKTAVIFDNLGRKVYENELQNATETIDVQHFSAGFYVLQIDVDGKLWTQKIVKE